MAPKRSTVNGLAGNDTFNVTASNVRTFVDGGDPIGVVGDTLQLTVPAGAGTTTFQAGPESDEGGFSFAGGGIQPVSYDHIEAVGPDHRRPAGGVVNIVATNADNDITIVGIDADSRDRLDRRRPGDSIRRRDDAERRRPGRRRRYRRDGQHVRAAGGINITGNDPTASDILLITGTAGLDNVMFTPTGSDAGSLTGLATPVNFITTEHVIYDGLDGADTLVVNGTLVDDTFSYFTQVGTGSGTFRSSFSPDFDFEFVQAATSTAARADSMSSRPRAPPASTRLRPPPTW